MDGANTPYGQQPQAELANDLLRGAGQIADFLFGSETERRKVYHLRGTSRMPTFRLGSQVCARRSVLLQWIAEQEKRCAQLAK